MLLAQQAQRERLVLPVHPAQPGPRVQPVLQGRMERFACTQAVVNTVTITSTATRWVLCNFAGGSPGTAGTVVNLTLPAAGSYPAGSEVTFSATAGTGAAIASFTFASSGSTLNATNANNASLVSGLPGAGDSITGAFAFQGKDRMY